MSEKEKDGSVLRSRASGATFPGMKIVYRYRGREITEEDVSFVRALIAQHEGESRRKLSQRVCQAWNWRQENGVLRDMLCRSLMLGLDRAGLIELPPVKQRPPNNAIRHRRTPSLSIESTPVLGSLSELGPLTWRSVRRTKDEPLFNALLRQHHYLGYTRPVGEHVKILVSAQDRPIACFAFSSAPYHLTLRDRFIGWSREARTRRRHLLAYNTRFLIVPWVRVRHLASHLLGQMARRISAAWEEAYAHPILYLESFVDTERFRGTCYRAANWIPLGLTRGRGKDCPTYERNRSLKLVMGLPLTKDFRSELCRLQ